ncbi:MAG: SDR family NAD(P)-dependent oxidoreductase, partial [Rhodospirillaceae bacterium]|nr:SDR family NAD(P)-dependent oxidoreductase [Rhodospirillaceae bacterium]
VPVHAFRLAGIYGPGRNVLEDVKSGRAKNIQKSDHVFSRIHVDDIANVVRASMARPNPGAVYNVCDDTPASPSHVVAYAAELLGQEPPPAIPYGEAEKTMSEMSKTFWADNKRVDNRRIKEELGVDLKYPGYREGLKACFQDNFSSN